ncbi:hypothetical protein PF005_g12636 [Phytophthora fragariae]|uniref:Uncharacterized protein n=2 Tax=Phytophthora TaxID=4783 RepID=A0A6A3TV51_9STRA|nr:hypothetical protein PF003_g17337 [Phytophthora fragariae]KAE9004212.1 hypothetical protein PR002_g17127 [Phytophthora rubi]KAE8936924.1 hypothetical protein PF009_g13174 [Phytophthora fragariae]KAE9006544.1 hypothetical protein PF011_g11545 [Phytophthora fragariae]KAE9010378.1 hypothetical protein PR001_g16187 [Phytophthora rubi]
MTLSELVEDVAALQGGRKQRTGRKRPRSASGLGDSRDQVAAELDAAPRPRGEDVPIPPIRVDKDLLVQVVRVKVQTLIRNAKLREQGLEQQPGKTHDPQCTAERLERLVPVIEQRWLQDLMRGDEPRYGFDEVVKAFQDIVHSD